MGKGISRSAVRITNQFRPSLLEPGATRNDALRAVARAWMAKRGAHGFPELDWDAISGAMLDVRAI